jgi:hypothetical protein
MTVNNLIVCALQELGLIGAGETPSAEDQALVFEHLNVLIDGWATQRLTMYTLARTVWTIASGTQTYTVGTGAVVNVMRPPLSTEIDIRYQDTSSTPPLERPLTVLTEQAWAAIPQKTLTSVLPQCAYYNPTYTVPTGYGTISLWMVPTSATLQGVLYAPQPVAQFAAPTDVLYLPPGYYKALRENLAVDIANDFERPVSQRLSDGAEESLANIKRANYRIVDLPCEAAGLFGADRPVYNIMTGP